MTAIRSLYDRFNTPIRKNFIANLFGIGVNLLNQLALVPVYLTFWGTQLYGDWIVLSALTSIFSMSDIGLNSVIQNRFAIKLSEKNTQECNALLIINFIVVTSIFIIVLAGCVAFLGLFDITKVLGLGTVGRHSGNVIFIMLIVQVFLFMYNGMPNSIFRGLHKNSQAIFYDQCARLGIFLVTAVCLILHVDMMYMSMLICVPIPICTILKLNIATGMFKLRLTSRGITKNLLRVIFVQSIGYMAFPISNAILLQGFTLVVNKFFGANVVVLYNTTRTMCNFIKTLLATVLHSVWPEFSIAYGEKNMARMRSLYTKSIRTSLVGAVVISLLLMVCGPWIYELWTRGDVQFNYGLMTAFLAVLIVNTLWNSGCVALLSTNHHMGLGALDVTASALSLLTAMAVAKYTGSIIGIVYSSLIVDVFLTYYVHKQFKSLIQDVDKERLS